MAVYTLARFEVKAECRVEAERAMYDFAEYVRRELSDSSWTTYRDPNAPTHYVSLIRADDARADDRHRKAPGTQAFVKALYPLLVADPEFRQYELVTSSDLAPRLRSTRTKSTRSRPAAARARKRTRR